MKPEVRVVKRVDREQPKRGNMPADRTDVLKTLEHIETQAGRLLKMVRDVKVALKTK